METIKYYLCGPTVYNYPHIGNLRPAMTFDILVRTKKYLGNNVIFLENITDIDDKIIKKAVEENKSEKEIAMFYEKYFLEQYIAFNMELPSKLIRVTDSLNDMYEYIQNLINVGAAYESQGNIFFDVNKYKNVYGKISGQKIENLLHDDENVFGKKSSLDFALWKSTSEGIKFDSPFGKGRPGWHTECSCFINKYFEGKQIDIHGGGIDLIFPHHENENIQHFALHNENIAKGWLHFGTLNYKNQKMSKSLGNIIYPHTFLEKYDADTYRLLILSTNYSKPINVSDELFESLQSQINKFSLIHNKFQLENYENNIDKNIVNEIVNLFANLDFSNALSHLIKLTKTSKDYATFLYIAKILGFNFPNIKISKDDLKKYNNWREYVKNKEYEKADILRNELKEKGII
ncbi:cysteine--tRNA ligase [Metamycoplasma equirhinis]|uniref:cysteine--tRNA ligase n=1 Tax=Metamycoplasma equirhinis TaxID=92402 RepID=UPI003593F78D